MSFLVAFGFIARACFFWLALLAFPAFALVCFLANAALLMEADLEVSRNGKTARDLGVTPGTFVPGVCSILQTFYLAMSFSAFKGRTLMTLRAGLALNICSTLVKGLMPLWALVAGF